VTRRRVLGLTALVLLALGAAGLAAVPVVARRAVVWGVGAATGREVTLAALDLELFGGRIGLRDFRLLDRDGSPLATIERLDVRFSPRDLLRGHLRIVEATLEAPALRLVRTGPREFNVSDLLGGDRGGGGGAMPRLTVERFVLRRGAVALEDRTLATPRTWRVEDVGLEVRGVSSVPGAPPGVVALGAVAAGAPISIWAGGVHLDPLRFDAAAIARGIEASLAALYLPPGSPLSPTGGTLDASATVSHAGGRTRLSLDAVFSGIALRRPGRETALLTAPAVRLTVEDLAVRPGAIELGRLAVDGGTAVLEDAALAPVRRWTAEGIAVELRNLSSARAAAPGVGSARALVAGSPVTVWIANLRLDPLELHATANIRNVDFALFRIYVPPDLPVQPERGVVNASIRVEHDERRGTRLGLDAGLTGVELRRPAHFLTAPSLRVTAEDIAYGAGAVTVGRVALDGDRLTIEDRTLRPARTWPVQGLAFEARRLSSRREDVQGIATARATVAGAAVSAWVTHVRLDPLELRATAIMRNLDLPLVQLYLPAGVPVQLDRGLVNASVQVDHDAGGTRLTGDVTLTGVGARGRDAAAGITLAAPSLRVALADGHRGPDTLTVGRLELTATGAVADSRAQAARADFERFRLSGEGLTWPVRGPARVALNAALRGGGQVDVSGTALLTAPPPMVAWTAELGVTLQGLDVAPVAAYVPAAGGLRGRVNARLAATVAYGAALTARMQGEASGERLALAEGGRTLVGLRGVEATGLDVLWPERVSVRRLHLVRPRARLERDRQGSIRLLARFAPPRSAGPSGGPDAASAPVPGGAAGVADVRAGSGAPSADAASPPAAPAPRRLPALAAEEVVVESGRVVVVDERDGAPVRIDVPGVDLTLRDARWPGTTPARLRLDVALPGGGTAAVEGTVLPEPASVDVKVAVADGDIAAVQPYVPFRAGVRGRVDATLTVAGPLAPVPALTARGEVTVKDAALHDGQRAVLTVERIAATGIDAAWPGRVDVARLRVRRSWALVERDRQGRFLLRTLLERPAAAPRPGTPEPDRTTSPGGAGRPQPFQFSLREGLFEEGSATIVDAVTTPAARLQIAGARLAVQDLAWPSRGPVKVQVASPAPGGGQVDIDGTLDLEPGRLDARARLDQVELAPAQPYLPIEGRVSGRITGDLTLKMAFEPLAVRVTGQARLQRFRLSDGDRPVVTAGRLEASGVDVEWPGRFAVERLLLRRPSLLIERDEQGEIVLRRLVTPRWPATAPPPESAPAPGATAGPSPDRAAEPGAAPAGVPAPQASPPPAPAPARPRPAITIGTVALQRGAGRFVDHTTTPVYTEQLSRVDVTITGLDTAENGRARFTGDGEFGGGGSFRFEGEAAAGERPVLELRADIRDFAIPRTNPYLEKYTTWKATSGSFSATALYTVNGTRLDARHDVVVRRLDVAQSGGDDEVEARLGLPLGFLVSLLKDARGEIRLSVPVSGDLGTREFDFQEAVWGSVRTLAIRLLALPFSRVGSLFFSEDSRLESVALAPVAFEAGTPRLAAGETEHLDRVAAFLRDAAAVTVRLLPVAVQADVDALKRQRVLARLGAPGGAATLEAAQREYRARWPDRPVPAVLETIVAELAAAETVPDDAMRELGLGRLEAVRRELASRGIDAARLPGSARRVALIESAGSARVEFDLRP